MRFRTYFVLSGLALLCAGIASAATSYSFDFTTQSLNPSSANSGGSLSMVSNGLTVTETAFWANVNNSAATVTGTSNDFARTWLGAYSGNGLGVCNPNEQTNCDLNNQHQIDSLNGLDFVNLAFSSAVSLSELSFKVKSFGNPTGSGSSDVDLSYAILNSTQESALNAGTLVFSTVAFHTLTSANLTSDTYNVLQPGSFQYLLIGAAVTGSYGGDGRVDAFKLQGVTITPEPASFVLIGSGLLAGALFRRRRKP